MEILEFGNKKKDIIILIHGMECPYQIFNEYIKEYQKKYLVIVPILPGHNINEDETFMSFAKCARELELYITSHYGNKIFAIYGLSMGGILACLLWNSRILEIKNLILESSPLLSYGKLMTKFLAGQYLTLTHKTQNRDKKTIEKAMNSIVPKKYLKEFLKLIDQMSDVTIKNYVKEIGAYKLPNNIQNNTNFVYIYGSKINEIFVRKTVKYIKKYYPKTKIIHLHGKGHCEDALLKPKKKIKQLKKILKS